MPITLNYVFETGEVIDPDQVNDNFAQLATKTPDQTAAATISGVWTFSTPPVLPASSIASGVVAPARLGSGTPTAGTVLRGDGTWAPPQFRGCRVYRGSPDQPIPIGATLTKVLYTIDAIDTDDWYSVATSRFTPLVAGYYRVTAQIEYNNPGAVRLKLYLAKNGTNIARHLHGLGTANEDTLAVSDVVLMNGTTDYIEAFTMHEAGVPRSLNAGTEGTFFTAELIGAA